MKAFTLLARAVAIAFCLVACVATRGDDAKPADDPPPEKKFTRMYDMRGWLTSAVDFPLDNSLHATGFVTPPNQPIAESERERLPMTRQEQMESLEKLITENIDPEGWVDNGGRVGAMREINGVLVITESAVNQKKIADLIKDLTSRQGETLHIYADWIILPHGDVSKLLKPQTAHEIEILAAPSLDPAALANLPATVRHFRAELLCLNGQTVSYISGRERTVTVGQTAIVGTEVAAFQPLVGNTATGIALQVNPVTDRATGQAVVTVFSTFNDPDNPGPPIPMRAVATQSVTGQPGARSESTASYRELNGVVQEFRTTLKMPIGTPVLVGSMTLEPAGKNSEAMELVMILSVHLAE